jgi:sugar transferase EpsL
MLLSPRRGVQMKRLFDLSVAIILFLILAPIFFFLSSLVYLKMGRPILFIQTRPGRNGTPFKLYKFRTMTVAREPHSQFLPDAERLSSFGRFLRNSSLDELPELFNVLKGEMSLVGPRPLLMQYLDRYTPEQARRHEAKPGITGWAQVNGRNAISWEDKFKFDVWYVDHRSFWFDIRIIFLTIWKIMKREGINQPGQVTTEEFRGSKSHG